MGKLTTVCTMTKRSFINYYSEKATPLTIIIIIIITTIIIIITIIMPREL